MYLIDVNTGVVATKNNWIDCISGWGGSEMENREFFDSLIEVEKGENGDWVKVNK